MASQWVAASLLDQTVLAALPGVDVANGTLQKTLSNSETAQVILNLDGDTPQNWEEATLPMGAVLGVYDDTDPAKVIFWAGPVTSRDRQAHTNQVPLDVVTFEGMFERAYVGDTTWDTSWFGSDIVADLINTWFIPSTGIAVTLDYTAGSGDQPTVDMVNQNTDQNTVKTVLDQVCAQLNMEYSVEWDWHDNGTKLAPRLVFGPHIGQRQTGPAPNVTLEMPGSLVEFTLTEDYSAGAGANKVIGYSSGQGATAPISYTETVDTLGRPVIEYRYTPAQSVSPDALSQYVRQAIKVLGPGAQPIAMTYSMDNPVGRRYGTDWVLGDDIGYRIPGSYLNEAGLAVTVWAFPNGTRNTVRTIAVQFDLGNRSVTPIAADPTIYVSG